MSETSIESWDYHSEAPAFASCIWGTRQTFLGPYRTLKRRSVTRLESSRRKRIVSGMRPRKYFLVQGLSGGTWQCGNSRSIGRPSAQFTFTEVFGDRSFTTICCVDARHTPLGSFISTGPRPVQEKASIISVWPTRSFGRLRTCAASRRGDSGFRIPCSFRVRSRPSARVRNQLWVTSHRTGG